MIPFCYTFNEFSKKSTFGYSDTSIQRKRGCFSKEKIIESVENTDFQHNIETKKIPAVYGSSKVCGTTLNFQEVLNPDLKIDGLLTKTCAVLA